MSGVTLLTVAGVLGASVVAYGINTELLAPPSYFSTQSSAQVLPADRPGSPSSADPAGTGADGAGPEAGEASGLAVGPTPSPAGPGAQGGSSGDGSSAGSGNRPAGVVGPRATQALRPQAVRGGGSSTRPRTSTHAPESGYPWYGHHRSGSASPSPTETHDHESSSPSPSSTGEHSGGGGGWSDD
ncbi:MAG: hypothetical protein GC157_03570 [Frankiales bacterium]|nr:hypothetical protein [Frankiales bacterium]